MNKDILAVQWKQIRGAVKAWWSKLTDNLERAAGKFDFLAGMHQEKYGYVRVTENEASHGHYRK